MEIKSSVKDKIIDENNVITNNESINENEKVENNEVKSGIETKNNVNVNDSSISKDINENNSTEIKQEKESSIKNEINNETSNNNISTIKDTKLESNKVIVKVDSLNKLNKQNEQENNKKMHRSEINICTNITRSLQLHSKAFPFLKPVDPVLLNIPDYLTVIKHPMDLSTIMSKIKENKYKDINEYISDVELMFNNCFLYNPPNNPVHLSGLALRDYFIEQLRRLSPEVQASLKILTKGSENNNLSQKDKRPKRQIKTVQHLEPEYHIPKKMKVVHRNTNDSVKEEKLTDNNEKEHKRDIIVLSKANAIKPVLTETSTGTTNNNKTTIKKLIATTRATKLVGLAKDKHNKNKHVLEDNDVEQEEEEEIGETNSKDEDQVMENDEEEDDDEEEEEEEEEEDDDEEDEASSLSRKTNSLIRASQKVLSRIKPKQSRSKIRNISAQTGSITKKSSKSKLTSSLNKVPVLPLDQINSMNSMDNIVDLQINSLTMYLQNVTKQLELLQVQSKARKLKKRAKSLAKSLNMPGYEYQSDSDDVEDILNQAALISNNANKLLKKKKKSKKIKADAIEDEEENNMVDDYEEEEEEEEEEARIIKKKEKKKPVKKRTKITKTETKGRKRSQKVSQENSYDIKRVCEYCGDTDTPMWRRGPNGKGTLCNKCGVKWKGGKIYQGEEIPMKSKKNKATTSTVAPPPKRERKTKTKTVKEKKKDTNKSNKSKQPKVAEITYKQKKELSEMINYLSEEKISGVVDIIKSSIPDIKDTQEEIELDIETIDPATLCKLYNYVKKVFKPKNNRKKEDKHEDTSSGESSGESSESDDDTSDSDSEPHHQFISRR